MKLTDYQHLEQLAAKNGAIMVDAADLLAWREKMAALRVKLADHDALSANCEQYHSEVERLRQVKLWARQAYKALEHISNVSEWNAAPLLDDAPAEVKS